jgi:hypothetical protein
LLCSPIRQAQHVVVEAVFFIPHVISAVDCIGNPEEVIKELRRQVFIGGIVVCQLDSDLEHVLAEERHAAWDLAFHSIIFSAIDLDFAKSQLNLMLQELYPSETGTKCAVHARVTVGEGQSQTLLLRLSDVAPDKVGKPSDGFDATMRCRRDEADEFYDTITPKGLDADRANVMRQAYAGMIWSK